MIQSSNVPLVEPPIARGASPTATSQDDSIVSQVDSAVDHLYTAQRRNDELRCLIVAILSSASYISKLKVVLQGTTFDILQRILMTVTFTATFLFCKYSSKRNYIKYRNVVMLWSRTFYFILPMGRNTAFLHRRLEVPHSSKYWDTWVWEPIRIILGTRAILMFVGTLNLALPVSLHVVAQIVSLAGLFTNIDALCQSKLLNSDAYHNVILQLSHCFEATSKAVLAGPSLVAPSPTERCHTIAVVMYIVVGLVLTTIVTIRAAQPIVIKGAQSSAVDRALIRFFSNFTSIQKDLESVLYGGQREEERNGGNSGMGSIGWYQGWVTVKTSINWWLLVATLWTLAAVAQLQGLY